MMRQERFQVPRRLNREPRANRGRARRCDPACSIEQDLLRCFVYAPLFRCCGDGKAAGEEGESEDLPETGSTTLRGPRGLRCVRGLNGKSRVDRAIDPGFFFRPVCPFCSDAGFQRSTRGCRPGSLQEYCRAACFRLAGTGRATAASRSGGYRLMPMGGTPWWSAEIFASMC